MLGFPGGSVGKESTCNAGEKQETRVQSLEREDPCPSSHRPPQRRAWQPTPIFLLENPMDRRPLLTTWGHKEFDMTEMTECTVYEVQ